VNISAEVSGRILYLGAKEGDNVTRGQLLVQIDDERYKASLNQMKYSLASAEATLEEARSQLKRVRELHDSNLASDAELEGGVASVKRFEANVDQARANVAQAEDALSKTKIFAPIKGVVTLLINEVGEMAIGASFNEVIIMVVSQLDKMEVNAEVNENDVVLLDINDPVVIEIFAMPDTSFRGIVTEIAHSGIVRGRGTAEEVTNFEVTVAVSDYVPELRPGMSATVEVETERRDETMVLPQEAVAVRNLDDEKENEKRSKKESKKGIKIKFGNKKEEDEPRKRRKAGEKEKLVEVVYVVENDTAWVRPVKLGIYSDTHFEILSGIEPGELVVTGPFRVLAKDLKSGKRVDYDYDEDEDDESGDDSEEKDVAEVEEAEAE
jgi:HlyD family secretion protein